MKILIAAVVALVLLVGCAAGTFSCPPYTRRVVAVGRIGTFYIEIRSPGEPNARVLRIAVQREALWHCEMLGYARAEMEALKIWKPHNRNETWGATLVRCSGEGDLL